MRVAIYFTPPVDHPLSTCAAEWLGRDAFDNRVTRDRDPAIDPLVSEPARYGFHATLKAPFRLNDDASLDQVTASLARFAQANEAVDLGLLFIRRIGRFFALVPDTSSPALHALETDIRTAFEPFRAPLTDAEIARRKPHLLNPRQRENLQTWGYPHIGEDFRFHMTLTNALEDDALAESAGDQLKTHFAAVLDRPVSLDGLALFLEREPGTPFEIHARYPLLGAHQPLN
jgi:putative phosphonate metabolism protein